MGGKDGPTVDYDGNTCNACRGTDCGDEKKGKAGAGADEYGGVDGGKAENEDTVDDDGGVECDAEKGEKEPVWYLILGM